MNQMLLSAVLPEKCHQIHPHLLRVRRSGNSKAPVTGAWNAVHVGMVAQLLEPFSS